MPGPGGGSRGSQSKRRDSGQGQPIDLDMTPMMNMLIILISFLVTMVVFTHLAVIKFTLPSSEAGSGGASADSAAQADVDITLVVSESGFQIVGEGKKRDPIPRGAAGFDFKRLGDSMRGLREEYPAAQSVVMLIDTSILYQDIVTAMDVCRDHRFPNILLSGGVYQ